MERIEKLEAKLEKHLSAVEFHQKQIESIKRNIMILKEMKSRGDNWIKTSDYFKNVLKREKDLKKQLEGKIYKSITVGGKIFYVTDQGEIYSSLRKYKGCKMKNGYIAVSLNNETKYVHRIVWEAFNGEIPNGMEIDHLNTVRTDNRLENLKLSTPKENRNNPITVATYKITNKGKISDKFKEAHDKQKKKVYQYTLDGKLIAIYSSTHEAERQNKGFNHISIGQCCLGKQKTHKNFLWSYEK